MVSPAREQQCDCHEGRIVQMDSDPVSLLEGPEALRRINHQRALATRRPLSRPRLALWNLSGKVLPASKRLWSPGLDGTAQKSPLLQRSLLWAANDVCWCPVPPRGHVAWHLVAVKTGFPYLTIT